MGEDLDPYERLVRDLIVERYNGPYSWWPTTEELDDGIVDGDGELVNGYPVVKNASDTPTAQAWRRAGLLKADKEMRKSGY